MNANLEINVPADLQVTSEVEPLKVFGKPYCTRMTITLIGDGCIHRLVLIGGPDLVKQVKSGIRKAAK